MDLYLIQIKLNHIKKHLFELAEEHNTPEITRHVLNAREQIQDIDKLTCQIYDLCKKQRLLNMTVHFDEVQPK